MSGGNGKRWRIELLGDLRVCGAGQQVERFRTQKTGALLGYLAYHLGRPAPRELLIEQLWPDDELDSARHKLSVALSSLRGQLEPAGVPDSSVLITNRNSARLSPAAVETDTGEFEARIHSVQHDHGSGESLRALTAAVEAYRGPLLPGYYEEWIQSEQRRLEALFFEAVRRLVSLLEATGETSTAIMHTLRAVAVDPLREENQRLLIRLYAATGQQEAAIRQYTEFCQLLREQLGTAPAAETRRLAEGIRGGVSSTMVTRACPLPSRFASPVQRSAAGLDTSAESGYALREQSHQPLVEGADEDPIGGAVPLDSKFYVRRAADDELERGIALRTSILRIQGPGEVGKTSLLARALQCARARQLRAVCTDFQLLNSAQLDSAETLLQALARMIAEQLDGAVNPGAIWGPEDGPNINFRRFIRSTVQQDPERPLVWALDNVDRLFNCSFGVEIFALLRAWHNERALDPTGPWSHLTLVIAYASEAHLFIPDVNQSPFNVGTRLMLEDFTLHQVRELNQRYGMPLRDAAELGRFHRLVCGHPYLVRRGLMEMAQHSVRLPLVEAQAAREDWVFGSHLRRLRTLLVQDPDLSGAMTCILRGNALSNSSDFYRLRSAGLVVGDSWTEARPRCQLYSRYLEQHLLLDTRSKERQED